MGSVLSTKQFSAKGDFITKEDVTLWIYPNNSDPTSIHVKKNETVKVLDFGTKWWQIKYKNTKGYSLKQQYVRKGAKDMKRNFGTLENFQ